VNKNNRKELLKSYTKTFNLSGERLIKRVDLKYKVVYLQSLMTKDILRQGSKSNLSNDNWHH
jgi:hypothetical protein